MLVFLKKGLLGTPHCEQNDTRFASQAGAIYHLCVTGLLRFCVFSDTFCDSGRMTIGPFLLEADLQSSKERRNLAEVRCSPVAC